MTKEEELKEYKKQWRIKNSEKLKEYHRNYYSKNKEKEREKFRKKYQENPKFFIDKVKKFRENNKEKVRIKRAEYTLKNKERRKKYLKENHKNLALAKSKYDKFLKVKSWSKLLVRRAKARATKCNFDFNLTYDLVEDLLKKQNNKCFWFGVDMKITLETKHPLQISLDRLDNNKGYTIDNVVLCTFLANMGRNSATAEVFAESVAEIKKILKYCIE